MYGCNDIETENKLKKKLSDDKLLTAYRNGKADHAFNIMRAIYEGAVNEKKEKLLLWLAENNLKKNIDAQTGDAMIDAMPHDERLKKIEELTKKLKLVVNN